MRAGDIVLVHFPFTDLYHTKVRPAVVICETPDVHKDVIVCMISSCIPDHPNRFEVRLLPSDQNGLRTISVIRIYRTATVDDSMILNIIGALAEKELQEFTIAFRELISV